MRDSSDKTKKSLADEASHTIANNKPLLVESSLEQLNFEDDKTAEDHAVQQSASMMQSLPSLKT